MVRCGLNSGTDLLVETIFTEPSVAPGTGTMKSTKEIGDSIKAKFDECTVGPEDVRGIRGNSSGGKSC